jgi:hypothetical protein
MVPIESLPESALVTVSRWVVGENPTAVIYFHYLTEKE